jgi:hypothetical protein
LIALVLPVEADNIVMSGANCLESKDERREKSGVLSVQRISGLLVESSASPPTAPYARPVGPYRPITAKNKSPLLATPIALTTFIGYVLPLAVYYWG